MPESLTANEPARVRVGSQTRTDEEARTGAAAPRPTGTAALRFTDAAAPQPTRAQALSRVAAVRPNDYARTRNFIDGAVSGLSPYLTHGLISVPEVLAGVDAHHALSVQDKFVFELGWRAYFRHVWAHRGEGIFESLHPGPLPDEAYHRELPPDLRAGCTGVPAIDQAVRTLYATGLLHNHARMWLASYAVHLRKVHWRVGADWMYGHLLDGDLASNHLSWQWVAGTSSHKPYLFNAANVARFAPPAWHSPGTVIHASYEVLERLAREPPAAAPPEAAIRPVPVDDIAEPVLSAVPPASLGATAPHRADVAGRVVWLVHPWNLGDPPPDLPPDTLVLAVFVAEFHRVRPWSARRWAFVGERMAELASVRWFGEAADLGRALAAADRVHSVDEPHLAAWLPRWAVCRAAPALFPPADRCCGSFSAWWARGTRGLVSARDVLAAAREAGW
jgi:deoxyribodipyrimidine photo-lyase